MAAAEGIHSCQFERYHMGNNMRSISALPVVQPSKPGDWNKEGTTGYCDVVRNTRTGIEAEQYFLQRDGRISLADDLNRYEYRRTQTKSLVEVFQVEIENAQYICQGGEYLKVKTERIPYRLSELRSLSFPEILYVIQQALVGFGTISELHGHVLVNDEMIAITRGGRVKVWLNENFSRNLPDPENDVRLSRRQGEKRPEWKFIREVLDTIEDHVESGHYPSDFKEGFEAAAPHNFSDALQFMRNYASSHSIPIPNRVSVGPKGMIDVPRQPAFARSVQTTVVEQPAHTTVFSQSPKTPISSNSPIQQVPVQRFSDPHFPSFQHQQQIKSTATSVPVRKSASEGIPPNTINFIQGASNKAVTFVHNDQRRINFNLVSPASQLNTAPAQVTPISQVTQNLGGVSRLNYFQAQVNQQSFLKINQNQISRSKPLTALEQNKGITTIFDRLSGRAPSLNQNQLSKLQLHVPPGIQPKPSTLPGYAVSPNLASVNMSTTTVNQNPNNSVSETLRTTPLQNSFPITGIHVLSSYNQSSRANLFINPITPAASMSNKSTVGTTVLSEQKPGNTAVNRTTDRQSIGRVPTAPVTSSNSSAFANKPVMFRSGAVGPVNVNFQYNGSNSTNLDNFMKGITKTNITQANFTKPTPAPTKADPKQAFKKPVPFHPAQSATFTQSQLPGKPITQSLIQPAVQPSPIYPGIPLTKIQQEIMRKRQNQQSNLGIVRVQARITEPQVLQPQVQPIQQAQQQSPGPAQNNALDEVTTEPDVTPQTLFEPRPNEIQRKQIKIIYESQQKDSMTLDNLAAAAYRSQQPVPEVRSALNQHQAQVHHTVTFEDKPVVTKQFIFQPQVNRNEIPTLQKNIAERVHNKPGVVVNTEQEQNVEEIQYEQYNGQQHQDIQEQRPQQPSYEKVRYQEQPLEYQKQYFEQLQLFKERREAEERKEREKLLEYRQQAQQHQQQEEEEVYQQQERLPQEHQEVHQVAEKLVEQADGHEYQQEYIEHTQTVRQGDYEFEHTTYTKVPQNNVFRIIQEPEDYYQPENIQHKQQQIAQTTEIVYNQQHPQIIENQQGKITAEALQKLEEIQRKLDSPPPEPEPAEIQKQIEVIEQNGKPIGYEVIETDVYYTPEGQRITVQDDYQVIYDEQTGKVKYIDVDTGEIRQIRDAKPEEIESELYANNKDHEQMEYKVRNAPPSHTHHFQNQSREKPHYSESPSAMHYFPVETVDYEEVVKPVNPMLVPRSYHSHMPSNSSDVPPNSLSSRLSAPRETSNKYTTEYGSSLKFSEEGMSSEGVVGELLEGTDRPQEIPTYQGLRANIAKVYGGSEPGQTQDYFARIERVDSLPYQHKSHLASQAKPAQQPIS